MYRSYTKTDPDHQHHNHQSGAFRHTGFGKICRGFFLVLATLGTSPAQAETKRADSSLLATELQSAREALAGKNFEEAALWFEKAAKKGDHEAQFYLGLMYQDGKGVKQDYDQALLWYKKSANAGNAEAQYNLANLHEKGLGVTQDNEEAIKWFRRAARSAIAQGGYQEVASESNQGTGPAAKPKEDIAAMCEKLRVAKQTPEEAAAEIMNAANQGDPAAQWKLGELYETGKGVQIDPLAAEHWKQIARDSGYKP
jgi:TPR repeat protein